MPPRNGIELAAAAMQQPQVKVLHPFNDVQLIALLAGHMSAVSGMKPEAAVEEAASVVAHAIVRGIPALNAAFRRLTGDDRPQLATE